MKKLIRKILFGAEPVREYSAVRIDGGITETACLRAGQRLVEVTNTQFLLCLQPAVFGIWITEKNDIESIKQCSDPVLEFWLDKKKQAAVKLQIVNTLNADDGILFLFKAKETALYQLNRFRRRLLYSKFYKKREWPFDKYKALIAAYSFPRKVRVVSFRDEANFNIFPMDLVGLIPGGKYVVFGLRHTNASIPGIVEKKRLVISEFAAAHKDTIYELGKHHGKSPLSPADMPFPLLETKQFGFYVPAWVNKYAELNIMQTLDMGSHLLLWGERVNEEELSKPAAGLYHLHFIQQLSRRRYAGLYPMA